MSDTNEAKVDKKTYEFVDAPEAKQTDDGND